MLAQEDKTRQKLFFPFLFLMPGEKTPPPPPSAPSEISPLFFRYAAPSTPVAGLVVADKKIIYQV
jgi:hypothetical protein